MKLGEKGQVRVALGLLIALIGIVLFATQFISILKGNPYNINLLVVGILLLVFGRFVSGKV